MSKADRMKIPAREIEAFPVGTFLIAYGWWGFRCVHRLGWGGHVSEWQRYTLNGDRYEALPFPEFDYLTAKQLCKRTFTHIIPPGETLPCRKSSTSAKN